MTLSDDSQSAVHILLVEFLPNSYADILAELAKIPATVHRLDRLQDIVGQVREMEISLILMDIECAGGDGFQAIMALREDEKANFTPIILLAEAGKNEDLIFKGYEAGCVDFLFRPLSPAILRAKLKVHLDLYYRQLELQEANNTIRRQNWLLLRQTRRDGLTGLYNHLHFQEIFAKQFYLAKRHQRSLALIMLDIDFFKEVNDSHGHQAGDAVLKKFADLLQGEMRRTDILARYGGEEFAVALPDTTRDGAVHLAEKIRRVVAAHLFIHKEIPLHITVSIGLAVVDLRLQHPAELIEQADHALYQAKSQGRNRFMCYEPRMGRPDDPCHDTDSKDLRCVRERLRTTLDKTRSLALASFEAMVHNQTKKYDSLSRRNRLSAGLIDAMGQRLNLPAPVVQAFHRSFKLHDLLRLFIADATLDKKGSLDQREESAIRDQPFMLKELTDLFDFFADERSILRFHHEHYDGHGYPEGLDGCDIPMGARLFALVDAVIAMGNPHYGRDAMDFEEIVAELEQQSGKQFDPFLVRIMLDIIRDRREFFEGNHQGKQGTVL